MGLPRPRLRLHPGLTFQLTWLVNHAHGSVLVAVAFHVVFNTVNVALLPVTACRSPSRDTVLEGTDSRSGPLYGGGDRPCAHATVAP